MSGVEALQFRGRAAVAIAAGLVVIAFPVAFAGCGGAAGSNLFSGSGSGGGDAGGGPPTEQPDSSSGSMTSGSPDAGAGAVDSSMPEDSSDGPGSFSTDADTLDTGTMNAVDSAPPPDLGIACGLFKCKPKAEVCCLGVDGQGDQTLTCESASDCANESGFPVPCADSLDCLAAGSPAGTVCCVTEGNETSSAASVACVAPSDCMQLTQALMCDPTLPGECPSGDTCSESMVTIPPYSICVK